MKRNKPIIEECDAVRGGKLISYYRYLIPQNCYQPKRYEQKTHTTFTKGDMLLAEMSTSALFTVDKEEKGNRFISRLQIETSGADSSNRAATKLQNLPELFAIPTRDVIVSLQKDGSIHEVLNHQQIFDLWSDIYRFLSSELTNEQFLKEIKETGDQEFGEIASSLRSVPLYYLFFLPLFNKEYAWGTKNTFTYKVTSNLLPKDRVHMSIEEKSIRYEGNQIVYLFDGRPDDDQIAKKIKVQFGSMMDATSTYQRFDTIECHIHADSGFPLLIKMDSTEEITGVLCYKQTITIELIDEDIEEQVAEEPSSEVKKENTIISNHKPSNRKHSWILDDNDDIFV